MSAPRALQGPVRPVLLVLVLGLLLGCDVPAGSSEPSDASPDGSGGDPGDDDDDVPDGPVENSCDDALDDDEDGLVDCQDPDCADVFHCTWPEELDVFTLVEFTANDIAESFGVGSCTLELGGTLDLLEDGAACEDCDRSYQGSLAVEGGDCPPDYIEPPSTGTYGFLFVSLGERELWKFDDDEAAWESLGEVQASGNVWQLEHSSPVLYDVPLFGPTEVGMFTVHETLTDL